MSEPTDDLLADCLTIARAMGGHIEPVQKPCGTRWMVYPPGSEDWTVSFPAEEAAWLSMRYAFCPDRDPAAFVAMLEWALQQDWNCGIVIEHSRAGYGCFVSDTCGIAYDANLKQAATRAVAAAIRSREEGE